MYAHTLKSLVPLPLTAVRDIHDNKRRPAGREGPERGGAQCPPAAATIVVVVVIDDGGVGADNQSPPPHAPNGRLDDVATVVVGRPPVVRDCAP